MSRFRQESILDAYNLILAGFLFVSPWLFAFAHGAAVIDDQISAAVVAAFSCAALLVFRKWEEWVIVGAGVWISASPWLLGFQNVRAAHFMFGVGMSMSYLALLELWLLYDRRPSRSA